MTPEAILMMASFLLGLAGWYLRLQRREREDLEWWAQKYNCPRLENESEADWRHRVTEKATRFMRGEVIR